MPKEVRLNRTVDGGVGGEESFAGARRVGGEVDGERAGRADDVRRQREAAVAAEQVRGRDRRAVVQRHRVELAARVRLQVELLETAPTTIITYTHTYTRLTALCPGLPEYGPVPER